MNNTNLIKQMHIFASFPWSAFCGKSASAASVFMQEQL